MNKRAIVLYPYSGANDVVNTSLSVVNHLRKLDYEVITISMYGKMVNIEKMLKKKLFF